MRVLIVLSLLLSSSIAQTYIMKQHVLYNMFYTKLLNNHCNTDTKHSFITV